MRDDSVSIAKAIGIMLMVCGHTYFSMAGNYLINMFNMPLFFFLSGYCLKRKYLENLKSYIVRRISGIYVPYIKWSLIFLLFHNIFFVMNIYNDSFAFHNHVSYMYGVKDFVSHAVAIVTKMSKHEQLLGGFWFLKSLFCGSIIAVTILKLVKNIYTSITITTIITIILSYYALKVPYFSVGSREFFAAIFFLQGVLFKDRINNKSVSAFSIIGIVAAVVGYKFWQATLLNFSYWQVIPYTLSALCGIIFIFWLSQVISLKSWPIKRILKFIGDNTMTILVWHLLCFKIVSIVIILVYNLSWSQLAEFPVMVEYSKNGWFIIYFIVGCIVPLCGLQIFYRVEKWVAAKK